MYVYTVGPIAAIIGIFFMIRLVNLAIESTMSPEEVKERREKLKHYRLVGLTFFIVFFVVFVIWVIHGLNS